MSQPEKTGGEPLFQKLSFLFILAVITAGFLFMVRHFVLTIIMAAVFSSLSYPLYRFLLLKIGKPVLASLATLAILLVILVLPIGAIIAVAYREAATAFRSVDFAALPATFAELARDARDRFPAVFAQISPEDVSQFTSQALKQGFEFILKQGAGWSVTLAANLGQFFLMLFMMFYFYADGERILRKVTHWSPLRDDYEQVLFRKFMGASHATLKGILVIGAIQGTIGATLFWLTGFHSPIFLGVLMVFVTVIPVLGAGTVWAPAALVLFYQGRIGAAIAVVAVGALIISTVDNFLRPILVGKEMKMHDLMVLLSTFGGLLLFGLPGFIIGPVLAALFLGIWTMYEEVFAVELARNRVKGDKAGDG